MADERFQRGIEKVREIHQPMGVSVLDRLDAVSPDLKRLMVEFAFGDIYTRPGLDTRTRQLLTLAMLAAQNNAPLQLKAHIVGSLHVGVTREEIVETFIQVMVYAGCPAAMNAMLLAKEVFAEQDAKQAKAENAG